MKIITLLAGLSCASLVFAMETQHQFANPLGEATWEIKGNKLKCQIKQTIPNFGDAYFTKVAGRTIHFSLTRWHELPQSTQATLHAHPTPWQHERKSETLGTIDVHSGKEIIKLETPLTRKMVANLESGMQPTFAYVSPGSGHKSVNISLSPVRFHDTYTKYMRCVHELLPYAYADIKDMTVYFPSNSYDLTDHALDELKKIRDYVIEDKTIAKLVVKGFSDNLGSPAHNSFLSTSRADTVEEFFIKRGVPAQKIETYAYGSKKPLHSNKTQDGRDKNRRVTIELIR